MKRKLSSSAFLKMVKDTIKQHDMLHPGDRALAAVSGGSDSVALLKALLDMRRSLGIEIVVANLDHGIRGRQSKRDSDFVRDLSDRLKLKFVHKRISLKSRRRNKKSLEEQAREERYAFLKEAARKSKCNVIATAHTLDDQAETVLMRIIAGTSVAGVTGIPPVRGEAGMKIIRPFIRAEKRDILHYLKGAGWKHVEDRTNRDIKFVRNRVRLEVLPLLEKLNPRAKRSLTNFADAIREDFLALKAKEGETFARCVKEKKGAVRVRLVDLVLQPRALRKAVFKESVRRAGGNIKKLTHRHWVDMDYFLRAGAKGKSLDFPGDIRVTRGSDEVVFKKRPH